MLFGNGLQSRSFCYVSDLIEVILRMMDKEGLIGPVNIGNPEEFTILELAKKVLELTGSHSEIIRQEHRSDDPMRRRPDIRLAREELGWEPVVALEDLEVGRKTNQRAVGRLTVATLAIFLEDTADKTCTAVLPIPPARHLEIGRESVDGLGTDTV